MFLPLLLLLFEAHEERGKGAPTLGGSARTKILSISSTNSQTLAWKHQHCLDTPGGPQGGATWMMFAPSTWDPYSEHQRPTLCSLAIVEEVIPRDTRTVP